MFTYSLHFIEVFITTLFFGYISLNFRTAYETQTLLINSLTLCLWLKEMKESNFGGNSSRSRFLSKQRHYVMVKGPFCPWFWHSHTLRSKDTDFTSSVVGTLNGPSLMYKPLLMILPYITERFYQKHSSIYWVIYFSCKVFQSCLFSHMYAKIINVTSPSYAKWKF